MNRKLFLLSCLFIYLGNVSVKAQSVCAMVKSSGLTGTDATQADIAKMHQYDVHYYKLDLHIENNTRFIHGNAIAMATVVGDLNTMVLQLHPSLIVDSVFINDSLTSFSRVTDALSIESAKLLTANSLVKTQVYYHGTPPTTSNGAIGLGFSNNAANNVTWSLSEPYAALEWWPCKQILTDKADSSEVWITTDSVNKAGSNGLLKSVTPMGGSKVRYEWKSTYPIAYYLISVAVAPYEEYNLYAHPAGADSILIQNYIYKNAASDVKMSIDYTPAILEVMSDKFGMYPFAAEKYGHCQAEIGGAMEHSTMTTIGYFDFDIIAHELGHQWFGDYVTCGSWTDIWLNEGFASYSEYVAIEGIRPEFKRNWLLNSMNTAKNAEGTVYVTDSLNVPVVFDPYSTYAKGSVLLHMLRYECNNDSLFFKGIRDYLQDHEHSNAFALDFKNRMAATMGKNLDYFFDQWYYNPGFPIINGKWNQSGNRMWLLLKQSPTVGNTIFKTSIDITFQHSTGDTTIRIWFDQQSQEFPFDMGAYKIESIKIDQQNNLLKEVISIAKDVTLGISEGEFAAISNILLYPNPSNDRINIRNGKGGKMEVFDMSGKLKEEQVLTGDDTGLSVKDWDNGIYLVRFSKNEKVSHLKFVKN